VCQPLVTAIRGASRHCPESGGRDDGFLGLFVTLDVEDNRDGTACCGSPLPRKLLGSDKRVYAGGHSNAVQISSHRKLVGSSPVS
jgi:hypothetical protein